MTDGNGPLDNERLADVFYGGLMFVLVGTIIGWFL